MSDDRVEGPIVPFSPYLRRPLRTLKEAEQDKDASGHHLMSVPDLPAPQPSTPPDPGTEPQARKKQP